MQTVNTLTKRWTHLVPLLMVVYLLAYLDRSNVAVILPYMTDMGVSGSSKGLISGIFFLGYIVLQVPSVLIARRWGVRPTITWMILGWAVAAVACGLAQDVWHLYAARFMLGVFEGGVLPVILLLISGWFLDNERARANTLFLTCLPLSVVIASPLTGWLLTFTHWRTVFVIEGLLPLIVLVPWLLIVRDRPNQVRWLDSADAGSLESRLDAEQVAKGAQTHTRYREVLKSRTVWLLVLVYFFWYIGAYGAVLWMPTVIKNGLTESTPLIVGLLSAVPYLVGFIAMLIASRTSHLGSRRMWIAAPLAAAGIALLAGQATGNIVLQMLLLCVVATGGYLSVGLIVAIPPRIFPTSFAAVAVAVMVAGGSMGGFFGPLAVGWLIDLTGSTVAGFLTLGVSFLLAAVLAMVAVPRNTPKAPDVVAPTVSHSIET